MKLGKGSGKEVRKGVSPINYNILPPVPAGGVASEVGLSGALDFPVFGSPDP